MNDIFSGNVFVPSRHDTKFSWTKTHAALIITCC